jgi:glycosyltransferase involved in cell wall biosynthesis
MLENSLETVPYTFESVVLKYPEETKGLISIIIPVYNTEQYLRQALDSVITQTFRNWEAILVDDGSTDKSSEICVEYTKKDPRFKYILKNNEGTHLARKTALENSRGEFIASLDSDDAYSSQFLEKMFAKIKEGDNDFVWCKFNLDEDEEKEKEIQAKNCELSNNKLENCCNVVDKFNNSMCTKLFKRNIYAKILFAQINGGFRCEDRTQVIQIVYHSNKAKFVPENLYFYRLDSETSIGSSTSSALKDKRYVRRIFGVVVVYQLMERFFGADEAEKFIVENCTYERQSFACYFLLSKKTITHYKIEYVENFFPSFLRGLKKSKNVKFFEKTVLILACKDHTLPYKIYLGINEIRSKLKIRTRIKRILKNFIHSTIT